MNNDERMLVRIVKEVCADEAIDLACFSYDWILRLRKNDRTAFLFGYNVFEKVRSCKSNGIQGY